MAVYSDWSGTHNRAKEGYFALDRVNIGLRGFIWGCHEAYRLRVKDCCRRRVYERHLEEGRLARKSNSRADFTKPVQSQDFSRCVTKITDCAHSNSWRPLVQDDMRKRILINIQNVGKRLEQQRRIPWNRLWRNATRDGSVIPSCIVESMT